MRNREIPNGETAIKPKEHKRLIRDTLTEGTMSNLQDNGRSEIAPLLSAFSENDLLRDRVTHVLQVLPEEVISDFLTDPQLQIHPIEKKPAILGHLKTLRRSVVESNPAPQAFLPLPGKDGRSSRCVTLKRKLEKASLEFCFYVIAHELAHAHLRNGCWGEISDREEAADALAKTWGFPKPEHQNWALIR